MLKNEQFLKTIPDAFDSSKEIMVSIIVDTFNHENYIEENLESILNQKVDFNVEILVHDDCSTDRTAEVIRKYEKKFPEIIKVIYQKENQFSKNIEIDSAFNYPRIKGKYVGMVEGDDKLIDKYKLYKQVTYLDKHPKISACIAKTIRFNMRNNSYGYYGLAKGNISRKYSLSDFIKGRDFSISSMLARKEFFVPPFPDFINYFAGFTDIQLGFYFALKNKVYYSSKPMSLYRQYSSPTSFTASFSNLSSEKKLKVYEKRIHVLTLLLKEVPKKYKKILNSRIKQEKFNLYVIQNNLDKLNTKEYKSLYLRKKRHDFIKKLLGVK